MKRTMRINLLLAGGLAFGVLVGLPLVVGSDFSIGMYFHPGLIAWLALGIVVVLVAFFSVDEKT